MTIAATVIGGALALSTALIGGVMTFRLGSAKSPQPRTPPSTADTPQPRKKKMK